MVQDTMTDAKAIPDDTTAAENNGSELGAALHADIRSELISLQATLGLPPNRTSIML